MKYKININLAHIINYIRSSKVKVNIFELLDWCIENDYLLEFYRNIVLIDILIGQKNQEFI